METIGQAVWPPREHIDTDFKGQSVGDPEMSALICTQKVLAQQLHFLDWVIGLQDCGNVVDAVLKHCL